MMTQTKSQEAAAPVRALPPAAAPASVADSGLIRIGAAVGRPGQR